MVSMSFGMHNLSMAMCCSDVLRAISLARLGLPVDGKSVTNRHQHCLVQRCMELEAAVQERTALVARLRRELQPPRARAAFLTRLNPSFESGSPDRSSPRSHARATPAGLSGAELWPSAGAGQCADAPAMAACKAVSPSCSSLHASADGCEDCPARTGTRGSRLSSARAAAGPGTASGSSPGSHSQQSTHRSVPSAVHAADAGHFKRRLVAGTELRCAEAEPESTASERSMRRLQERHAPGSRKRSQPDAAGAGSSTCDPASLERTELVLEGAGRMHPGRSGPYVAAHAQHARLVPSLQDNGSDLAEVCSCACSTSESGDHAPGSLRACLQQAVQVLADEQEQPCVWTPHLASQACEGMQGGRQPESRAGGCRVPAGAIDVLAAVAGAAAAVSDEAWKRRAGDWRRGLT